MFRSTLKATHTMRQFAARTSHSTSGPQTPLNIVEKLVVAGGFTAVMGAVYTMAVDISYRNKMTQAKKEGQAFKNNANPELTRPLAKLEDDSHSTPQKKSP